mmetsp:Transcript_56503/g.132531  ORF Transcript_56503/g.132531 Transcript_56503/m.132531 type:complete len:252 (+) Transcript_56503:807-1562(+)
MLPGLLREPQVEGIDQQRFLRGQDPRTFPLVAHIANSLHEVHLGKDGPESHSIDCGRHWIRIGVLFCFLVAEQDICGRAPWATVKKLVQELVVVSSVSLPVRSKEPAEAEVRGLDAVSPATGQIRSPSRRVVEVQPSEAPPLLPQEVVDVLTVPTAVTKVHDMPGLRYAAALLAQEFHEPLKPLVQLVTVDEARRKLPQEGDSGGCQVLVLFLPQRRPPLQNILQFREVGGHAAHLHHHSEGVSLVCCTGS